MGPDGKNQLDPAKMSESAKQHFSRIHYIFKYIYTEKKTCKTVQQVRKSAGKLGMVDMKWEAYSIILGWVNVYKNLRFFNDFIIRPQASSFTFKSIETCKFSRILAKKPAEIERCANFLALRRDKTVQNRERIFCSQVPMLKFSKYT